MAAVAALVAEHGPFDTLLCGDVVYLRHTFAPLLATMGAALAPGGIVLLCARDVS